MGLTGPIVGSTLDQVFDRMTALAAEDDQARSRRAIFLQLYVMVTDAVRERIRKGGYFQDNDWAARYLVAFANLYADARFRYDKGESVPRAWRIAFQTADTRSGLILQDILLGVNAHINHDLAFALIQAGIGSRTASKLRESRYRDHTAVNAILEALTNRAQDKIAGLYAPGLKVADGLAGPLDEIASAFSIEHARESAWRHAVMLANARSSLEQQMVSTGLDLEAGVLGKLILAPARIVPGLLAAFSAAEQGFRLS